MKYELPATFADHFLILKNIFAVCQDVATPPETNNPASEKKIQHLHVLGGGEGTPETHTKHLRGGA